MINRNRSSTRYYSNQQEEYIARLLDCHRQSNSGSGCFNKGDLINKEASLLIECKTVTSDKESFSIKRGWLEKNKQEAFEQGLENHCLAFNFTKDGRNNYFIIDEKLMHYLMDRLRG